MRLKRKLIKFSCAAAMCGGLLFSNGCFNFLTSLQICGVIVPATICTPEDQLLLTFQFQEVPNFDVDPSCTIPFSCGTPQYPFGGGPPTQPPNTPGGGGAGGGGAGGGI